MRSQADHPTTHTHTHTQRTAYTSSLTPALIPLFLTEQHLQLARRAPQPLAPHRPLALERDNTSLQFSDALVLLADPFAEHVAPALDAAPAQCVLGTTASALQFLIWGTGSRSGAKAIVSESPKNFPGP